jgi:VWFA-related protein
MEGFAMTRRPRFLALALLTLSLSVSTVAAQEPAPAFSQEPVPGSDEIFADSIDVRVINIEVFVTGPKGKRVTGLTRDDFEVYEDGRRVEVTHFYAAEPATSTASPLRPGPVPEAERLQLAVYFDTEDLPEGAIPRIVHAVEEFVVARARPDVRPDERPDERVIVAHYHGADSLAVREVPVNRPALSAALSEMARAPQGASLSGLVSRLGSKGTSDRAVAEMNAQSEALRRRGQAKSALDALDRFVAALGSLPGRKALLYVSGKVSFSPGQSLFTIFENKLGLSVRQGAMRPLVKRLEDTVNSDRIVFYGLGARNSRATSISAAAYDPKRIRIPRPGEDVVDIGRDLTDANPAASLAWIGEDLDSYYSLGYTPDRRPDGKRHRVEVRVKRRGLDVRYLEAYRDRTPADRAEARTLASLLLGDGENPLGVTVEFGPAEAAGKEGVTVPVTLRLPLARMALLPGSGGAPEGRLSIVITVRDDQGRMSEPTRLTLPVRPDGEIEPGQQMSFTTRLLLRPIPHTVVVGVRDELGNTLSTVTSGYNPPSGSHGG